MTRPNDFANPIITTYYDEHNRQIITCDRRGLTKREYFAAMALQGILAMKRGIAPWEQDVKVSVHLADLLIEELNKPKTHGNENHQP